MMSHFDKVCDFHIQCGVNIPTTPQYDLFTTNPVLIDKAVGFIEEEVGEYSVALEQNDAIEMVDALVDISYFVLRLCALLGSNMDDVIKNNVSWRSIYVHMVDKKC